MTDRVEIVVPTNSHKERLDEFLFGRFGGLSKMYLRDVVKNEQCEVNGRPENVGYRLRGNDFIEISLDLSRETAMRPQEIPLDVVFEDEHLIAVNKAAGMLVHPTNRDKSGTLLNALSFYLNKDGKSGPAIRPGLVHRLDKATSGLMVIAKHKKMHKRLTALFQHRYVRKTYLALLGGIVEPDEGVVDAPIGRYGELKHWNVKEGGKPSETSFRVIERRADTTLVEMTPVTGRTNQLRIHAAHIGHPIVGDAVRGGRPHSRLCLHASRLEFIHPFTKKELSLEAKLPNGFDADPE